MDVLKAISDRRSHRAYRKEQVPEDVLGSVLKAGLEAPSARNHQPWHFSVVQDAALIQEVHDEAAKVMGKNRSFPGHRWIAGSLLRIWCLQRKALVSEA